MFTFILFQEKKKALAMTIALGIVLGVLAAVLVPAIIAAPPRFKAVEARVEKIYEGTGPEDPPWVEYWYEYKIPTYIVRLNEPADSLSEGDVVRLYVNSKKPDMVLKERPAENSITMICLIVMASASVLFASTLVNYILVRKKEKRDANTQL